MTVVFPRRTIDLAQMNRSASQEKKLPKTLHGRRLFRRKPRFRSARPPTDGCRGQPRSARRHPRGPRHGPSTAASTRSSTLLLEPHPRAPSSASRDRFFYQNDPVLTGSIRSHRGDLIAADTDIPRADPAGTVPPTKWSPRHLGRRAERTPCVSRSVEGREERAGPPGRACSRASGDP